MAAALPDDMLAEVLRHLGPRSLAACCRVCKPWRDLVDDRRLLRADLLPRSLAGIFLNFSGLCYPEFFARPSTTAGATTAISSLLDFLPFDGTKWYKIEDHCNGLLLLDCNCVVNPATRWWARLPPRPPPREDMERWKMQAGQTSKRVFIRVTGLPTCIPIHRRIQVELEPSEWPPPLYVLPVFSSRTERWEERTFVREGEAAGNTTVPDKRISLRNDKYQVIKLPKVTRMPSEDSYFCLGRSQKGVYLALARHCCHLLVWILDESCDGIKWELKHDKDIKHILLGRNKVDLGPWILQEINYQKEEGSLSSYEWFRKKLEYELNEEATLEKSEWNSDDDNAPCNEDIIGRYNEAIDIIGFHPFKEIIFFSESFERGIAYHLNGSKVEDLGDLYPVGYDFVPSNEQMISASYPYTPCWM
ncbi:hypothetical protein DAI22_03g282700 [Oryza sativa Japonica Group]|nr:hypothetical protein DAI22_03g282700 [Oryza sativa Japonica Group]